MGTEKKANLTAENSKKKITRHLIITSDDVTSAPKEIKYNPTVVLVISVIVCVLLGGLIGFVFFEKQKDAKYEQTIAEMDESNHNLVTANQNLYLQVESLEGTVDALSDAVNIKTAHEEELEAEIEEQWIPSAFPMSDSATLGEYADEELGVILKSTGGGTVVASASGKVVTVEEDETYGNVIVIDHGNGYLSYYKNSGSTLVRVGDTVVPGTTLYLIGNDNTSLCYQISYNSEFIDPMDLLDIKG